MKSFNKDKTEITRMTTKITEFVNLSNLSRGKNIIDNELAIKNSFKFLKLHQKEIKVYQKDQTTPQNSAISYAIIKNYFPTKGQINLKITKSNGIDFKVGISKFQTRDKTSIFNTRILEINGDEILIEIPEKLCLVNTRSEPRTLVGDSTKESVVFRVKQLQIKADLWDFSLTGMCAVVPEKFIQHLKVGEVIKVLQCTKNQFSWKKVCVRNISPFINDPSKSLRIGLEVVA